MLLGTLVGALFGYVFIGGLFGAFIGAALGHLFDRARARRLTGGGGPGGGGMGGGGFGGRGANPAEAQRAFFEATFAVMGHVAKADGHVDAREIALAEQLMNRMNLDAERRREAIARFNEGKQADFVLADAVHAFRQAIAGQRQLLVPFLEIQIQAALADGELQAVERAVLIEIAGLLGIPELMYRQLEKLVIMSVAQGAGRAGAGGPGYTGAGAGSRGVPPSAGLSLEDAYDILGVSPSDDRNTVKTAWRKLMSEHHPDKLVARGLPREMMEMANDKAQGIQKAWERVREARGWR